MLLLLLLLLLLLAARDMVAHRRMQVLQWVSGALVFELVAECPSDRWGANRRSCVGWGVVVRVIRVGSQSCRGDDPWQMRTVCADAVAAVSHKCTCNTNTRTAGSRDDRYNLGWQW